MTPSLAGFANPATRAALWSLACLLGGIALAFPLLGAVSHAAPALADRGGPALFHLVLAVCAALGAAVWGRGLAAPGRSRRATLAASAGYGLAAPLAVWSLTAAETALLGRALAGDALPMHLAFGALFPSATALVVLLTVGAFGLGAGLGSRALRLAGACALRAGLAFLLVVVAMDLIGFRVGAPGAEKRFTMVVVMLLGLVASTVAAGAALGRALAREAPAGRA